jgi:hypothetical protein
MIDNWLGTTTEPAAPQTPGGAQPVKGNQPLPPRAKAGVVAKGTIVYDPQGKPHTSDGTHPLPQGWTTKKAN